MGPKSIINYYGKLLTSKWEALTFNYLWQTYLLSEPPSRKYGRLGWSTFSGPFGRAAVRKSDAKRPDDGGKYQVLDLAIFMSFLQGENIRDFYYKLAINNIPPIASTGLGLCPVEECAVHLGKSHLSSAGCGFRPTSENTWAGILNEAVILLSEGEEDDGW